MSLDLVLLCVAMALYIGFKVGEAWYLFTFRKMLEDLNIKQSDLRKLAKQQGIDLSEEPEEDPNSDLPVLEVRVEKNELGLFAYRKDNSLFLARGADRQELMANLIANLNNVRVIVRKEDGGDYISP